MRRIFSLVTLGIVVFVNLNSCMKDSNKPTGNINNPFVPAGMKLIHASGKSFSMGSTNGYGNEEPVHTVIFTYDFCIDSTEVTQADYTLLMGINPSYYKGENNLPVENVSWFDAVLYCNNRSKRDSLDTIYTYVSTSGTLEDSCTGLFGLSMNFNKNGYRLPTEAEYEYSCRAGTSTDFFWGKNYPFLTYDDTIAINTYVVWVQNSFGRTEPVGTKKPNAWCLYDMVGNVSEWCNDWCEKYNAGTTSDPIGSLTGTSHVVHGGAFNNNEIAMRSSFRGCNNLLSYRGNKLGFRCVKRLIDSE